MVYKLTHPGLLGVRNWRSGWLSNSAKQRARVLLLAFYRHVRVFRSGIVIGDPSQGNVLALSAVQSLLEMRLLLTMSGWVNWH